MAPLNAELTATPERQSAGQDARLYGRRDARRYAEQILSLGESVNHSLSGEQSRPVGVPLHDARCSLSLKMSTLFGTHDGDDNSVVRAAAGAALRGVSERRRQQ